MPRLLHLAGHRELPQYFDIDDSTLFDVRFDRPRPDDPEPGQPPVARPAPDITA
jgi:hypothetical protein